MHLIKTSANSIDDFENGLTYTLTSMPDYESGDIFHSLWRRHWNHKGATDSADVTHGHTALRIWKHLESILAFDATKDDPQPAPVEADVPRKFKEGDRVVFKGSENGEISGTVTEVYKFQTTRPYCVHWDDDLTNVYADSEIEPAD